MSYRIKSALAMIAAAAIASATSVNAQTPPSDTIRIGYQKSSTLTAILKTNGELEKALAPLGVRISWHEFTSGLPLLEAINTGNVDFGADVADTVPLFAQAAGAKLAYIAEEAASPSAQAILVGCGIADPDGRRPQGQEGRRHQGRRQSFPAARRARQSGPELQGYLTGLPYAGGRTHGLHRRQCRCMGGVGSLPHQRPTPIQCAGIVRRQQRACELQALLSVVRSVCRPAQRRVERDLRQAR